MSKYEHLWKWIRDNGTDSFKLTYVEIEEITGVSKSTGSRRYPNGIQGNNNVSVQGNRISEGI